MEDVSYSRKADFVLKCIIIFCGAFWVIFFSFKFLTSVPENKKSDFIELKTNLVELVIASDPTLSSEEIKNKVNDLYKFIIEDKK